MRLALEGAFETARPQTTVTVAQPASAVARALPWVATGIFAVALLTALVLWAPWRSAPVRVPCALLASIGADASLSTSRAPSPILSPDGTTLAFVAQQAGQVRLFIRKLDQLQAAPLAGTEDADGPFFSPDGQWVAFFAGDKLKKVAVTGGAAVSLCDARFARGGTWADDDTILFANGDRGSKIPLIRVAAAGGTPAAFGMLSQGAVTQRWPQALPGGTAVLYTEASSTTNWDGATLVVAPLAGGSPKVVVRGGHYGRYVPSGHLIYMNQSTLFAVRFDRDRLETLGQAVPVLDGVAGATSVGGGAQLAVSAEGTLVYVPGMAATAAAPIDWLTRDGKRSVLRAVKSNWANPRFSPDGQKLALEIFDGKQHHIWVYEWARDTLMQLTVDKGQDRNPVWTPDGRRITFASDRARPGVFNLYWANADGSGDIIRLTDSPEGHVPRSWHPSGKYLAFEATRGANLSDLMILPIEGDGVRGWTPGKPTVLPNTPADQLRGMFSPDGPMFSPDGRWIAYASNEAGASGARDVYVRPFPGPGGPRRISTEGGNAPRWSAATHELLFRSGVDTQGTIVAAAYSVAGESFRADAPQIWSPTNVRITGTDDAGYDLHPDGKRIATAATQEQAGGVQDKSRSGDLTQPESSWRAETGFPGQNRSEDRRSARS
jgi:eukaryotic-like serine/threonine-protein kinase